MPQRHVLQAKEVLIAEGSRPRVRQDGRVAVDLHWVMPSYFAVPLDPNGLWDRLEPIDLLRTAVLSLPRGGVLYWYRARIFPFRRLPVCSSLNL